MFVTVAEMNLSFCFLRFREKFFRKEKVNISFVIQATFWGGNRLSCNLSNERIQFNQQFNNVTIGRIFFISLFRNSAFGVQSVTKFHVHDFEIFDIWENMKEAELKTVIKTGKLEYLYAWKVVCYPSSVWFCKSRSTLSRRTFWKFSFSCKFHVSWIDGVLSYDMLVTTEGQ